MASEVLDEEIIITETTKELKKVKSKAVPKPETTSHPRAQKFAEKASLVQNVRKGMAALQHRPRSAAARSRGKPRPADDQGRSRSHQTTNRPPKKVGRRDIS